ncbi:MAG: hypothetical protein AAF066_02080 [Pseudomonadota bacterium]
MKKSPKYCSTNGTGISAAAMPAHCTSFSALYDASARKFVDDLRHKFGNGLPDPEDLMQEALGMHLGRSTT